MLSDDNDNVSISLIFSNIFKGVVKINIFINGGLYSRKDIQEILDVPKDKRKGAWTTGYTSYNGDYYIFCNIGVAGKTGHNYDNRFIGKNLSWYGKTKTNINQDTIKKMISGKYKVHIFTREDNTNINFIYQGEGKALEVKDTVPVNILWGFVKYDEKNEEPMYLEEDESFEKDSLYEGSYKTVRVNIYERNKAARDKCLEQKGYSCTICGFDFYKVYGEIGKNFIHVHHITPLYKINKEYEVDPINDLIPICPNCHAMIHRKKPELSIDELKNNIKNRKES